ncbi:MAG: ABC transporter permease [Gemmatimonadetes bacterium]|nr:ABC transporter permease [Gemmatimonadota bacterium]
MSERRKRRARRVGRPDVRRDVEDEVMFHLEASVRDLMAQGLDEASAREEALRRFGSVRRVEDRLVVIGRRRERRRRAFGWLAALSRDIAFAVRNLRRHPAFAAMMVVILALGVAVNAAVFRVVDGALLRPLPYPAGESLVRVFSGDDLENRFSTSLPEYRDWAREADVHDASAAFFESGRTLLRDGVEAESILVGAIEGDFMRVLGMPPLIGRGFSEEDNRRGERVLLLDETVWRTRYGASPSVLGETVRFVGESYTVIGVMPAQATVLFHADPLFGWIPLVEADWMSRGLHFLRIIARLKPGLGVDAAAARSDVAEQAIIDAGTTDHGMILLGLREQIVSEARPTLLVLAGAVAFVLLIVCANLTNLFYAHALGRWREFAVRASLGAGRGRLVRLVVTEGLVVGAAGAIVGLMVSSWLGGIVSAAAGRAALLTPSGLIDLRVTGFTLAIALLAGCGIGAWPALRAGFTGLGDSLKDGARTVGDRHSWKRRRWLVGAEVALSVVLLAGAGLMIRSVARLLDQDPGFEAQRVLTVTVSLPVTKYDDAGAARFHDELVLAVRELPGVIEAGASSHVPLGGSDTNGGFSIVGRDASPDDPMHTMKRVVTPGYFEAMRIPIIAGRLPGAQDHAGASDIVVISETLARRYWPGESAVGRRVRFSWGPDGEQEIIGVVGDIRHTALDRDAYSMMYRMHAHFPLSTMTLMVRTAGDPIALVTPIREVLRRMDPDLPLMNPQSMQDVVTASIGDRSTLMRVLTGFAGLALLLAALGVYAVASQAVQQRRAEIGVRMAIGAHAKDVLRMVMRQELIAVGIGVTLGVAAALAATRVLEASLFGVTARDPGALAGAAALIATAALVATLLPASRAARTDPAVALRDG